MAALRHKKEHHKKEDHMKKGGAHHMKHRKFGGKTNEHEYNAVGAPEMAESHEEKESFKKGGVKKLKHGGHAEKAKSAHRPDKKPRRAMGGSVLSHASKKTAAMKDAAGQGHQADGPKGEDKD